MNFCDHLTTRKQIAISVNIKMLEGHRHWLFDMDGTLTIAMHDFDAMRHTLGLPEGVPILEALAALPTSVAREKHQQLDDMELDMADAARAQPGAVQLLQSLSDKGARLGIVTRNGKIIAERTLAACGLDTFFSTDTIVSRDCCAAKPDPAGVQLMIDRWSADASDTVMIGDYRFDLEAGRNAGVTTVHLDVDGIFPWPELTDVSVKTLDELNTQLSGN